MHNYKGYCEPGGARVRQMADPAVLSRKYMTGSAGSTGWAARAGPVLPAERLREIGWRPAEDAGNDELPPSIAMSYRGPVRQDRERRPRPACRRALEDLP